jgi:hypothetical protein
MGTCRDMCNKLFLKVLGIVYFENKTEVEDLQAQVSASHTAMALPGLRKDEIYVYNITSYFLSHQPIDQYYPTA